MTQVLAGRLEPERDAAFTAWAESRRHRLLAAARSRDMDALLIRCDGVTDPALAPLLPVDFESRTHHRVAGGVLLLGPEEWFFRPDSPWELEEARALGLPTVDPRSVDAEPSALWAALAGQREAGGRIGLVGFDGAASTRESGSSSVSEVDVVALDGDFVLDRLRSPSAMETAEIDRVCRVNDMAMRAVARRLVEAVVVDGVLWLAGHPLTIGRVRRAAIEEAARAGLSFPEGCLVSAAAAAANPHDQGDDQHRLREGQALVVDLFPRGALFSDMTRTFVPGGVDRSVEGDSELVRALSDVEEALRVAEKALGEERSDGTDPLAANRVQRSVQQHFQANAWPVPSDSNEQEAPSNEGFVHGLGHGVGYRLHQAPWFSDSEAGTDRGTIRPGEAFTLEPGLYRPGAWGVRIEDVYRLQSVSAPSNPREVEGGSSEQEVAGPLELVRLTKAPRCTNPAEFLYEFARRA